VTVGPYAVRAAKQATTTIPIVAIAAGDLLGEGLVRSLTHPRGNVTGLSYVVGPEIVGKWMQLLNEGVPKLSTIVFLHDAAFTIPPVWQKELESAPARLGMNPSVAEFRSPDTLEDTFARIPKTRVTALLVNGGPHEFMQRRRIIDLAARYHLPALYTWRQAVTEGGLMSYAADFLPLFRHAAIYVDRILKGAKAGDLPVEQPTKFELVINMKTAKALGLTIPPSLLLRADEVIQ
jgi:putative ABC transport system substrate-binding protein